MGRRAPPSTRESDGESYTNRCRFRNGTSGYRWPPTVVDPWGERGQRVSRRASGWTRFHRSGVQGQARITVKPTSIDSSRKIASSGEWPIHLGGEPCSCEAKGRRMGTPSALGPTGTTSEDVRGSSWEWCHWIRCRKLHLGGQVPPSNMFVVKEEWPREVRVDPVCTFWGTLGKLLKKFWKSQVHFSCHDPRLHLDHQGPPDRFW